MIVKSLENIPFSEIISCFLKAFENYFVKMPLDHEYYKQRWEMAKVNFNLSYGIFDDGILVGFIINAIDKRNHQVIAFNTGTGVLPKYRGQGIVKTIYTYAIPELLKHGVSRCRLEVIKENIAAIKAYERVGFKINKHYKCYSGSIELRNKLEDFHLKQVDIDDFNWNAINQGAYSWDNQIETIKSETYKYYVVLVDGIWNAYFVINVDNGYLAQFDVIINSESNWFRLFTAIERISSTVRINNVNEALVDKMKFLSQIGLENTVDQYEMEMGLV